MRKRALEGVVFVEEEQERMVEAVQLKDEAEGILEAVMCGRKDRQE